MSQNRNSKDEERKSQELYQACPPLTMYSRKKTTQYKVGPGFKGKGSAVDDNTATGQEEIRGQSQQNARDFSKTTYGAQSQFPIHPAHAESHSDVGGLGQYKKTSQQRDLSIEMSIRQSFDEGDGSQGLQDVATDKGNQLQFDQTIDIKVRKTPKGPINPTPKFTEKPSRHQTMDLNKNTNKQKPKNINDLSATYFGEDDPNNAYDSQLQLLQNNEDYDEVIDSLDNQRVNNARGTSSRQDNKEEFTHQGDSNINNFIRKSTVNRIYSDTKMNDILELHKKNKLSENQFGSSKEFMKQVMYSVPLDKLYRVMASCQFAEDSDFCPVLLQIKDKKVLEKNDGKAFLVQVWTKDGVMVFEKSLYKPISNWNISHDKFIFQENRLEPVIYVVRLFLDKQPILFKFTLPKSVTKDPINCFWNEQKEQFLIPDDQVDTDKSEKSQDAHDILGPPRTKYQSISPEEMLTKHQRNDSTTQIFHKDNETQKYANDRSISEVFKDKIIERTPDKMIDVLDGSILLAYRHIIIYFSAQQYGVQDLLNLPDPKKNFFDIEISEEQLCYLDLHKNYKIITIQDFGQEMSAIVLEDLKTRQVRFLRPYWPENAEMREIQLVQLGVIQAVEDCDGAPCSTLPPLLKYRSITKYDTKSKKYHSLGLVLRRDGRFEVFSDFIEVSKYYQPLYQCVDIDTDFCQFFLKFVNNKTEQKDGSASPGCGGWCASTPKYDDSGAQIIDHKTNLDELKFEIRQVLHFWRNRISFRESNLKNKTTKWHTILHHRISKYFKIYSQIMNFSMHMLVSHRNMISVFDMSKDSLIQSSSSAPWVDTVDFPEGQIRKMFIKKRSKKERREVIHQKLKKLGKKLDEENMNTKLLSVFKLYTIVCFIGNNEIKILELNSQGFFRKVPQESTQSDSSKAQSLKSLDLKDKIQQKKVEVKGRVLSFQNDDKFNTGILVLTDDTLVSQAEFKIYDDCNLYVFPLSQNLKNDAVVTLHTLHLGILYRLIQSDANTLVKNKQLLAYDSYFKVMIANNGIFEVDQDQGEQQDPLRQSQQMPDCQIEDQVDIKHKFVNVVMISNQANKCAKIFALKKQKIDLDPDKPASAKVVTDIKLLTDEKNSKKISLIKQQQKVESSPIHHSFFTTVVDFKENKDTLAQISKETITLYDKKMKTRISIDGLNIRCCKDLHNGYLYSISDSMIQPYGVTNYTNETGTEQEPDFNFRPPGLYCIDIKQLFKGNVEKYKIANAIGGACSYIDISKFSNRLSFLQDYNSISVIPFPHLNLINCVGMSQKHDYLIWREKNGFFTALDRKNNIFTWSLVTGKLLYSEKLDARDANLRQLRDYSVYRSDEIDINYTQNLYSFDEYSLTLLKEQQPILPQRKHNMMNEKQVSKAFEIHDGLNNGGLADGGLNTKSLEQNLFLSKNTNLKIDIRSSMQEAELYHFKVISLKVHEDTKTKSQCLLKFHFHFSMIKKRHTKYLEQFDWDINQNPVQRLWISEDTRSMMEVINNFIAKVYYRVNIDKDGNEIPEIQDEQNEDDHGQLVRWKVDYHINRFPRGLVEKTSVPYLFSPNFTFQFDFSYLDKEFRILQTRTQKLFLRIPQSLINMEEWDYAAGQGAVSIICSRIKWESETRLRIINEGNIECIFELSTTDETDTDVSKRFLKLLSSVKIDNEYENMSQLNSPHMIYEPSTLTHQDVLERLIRLNQDYKCSLQHAINLGHKNYQQKILTKINKVDYFQPWELSHSSFDVELSFTLLDWRILELFIQKQISSIGSLDTKQALRLCFNIFPKGRGVLHQLIIGSQDVINQKNLAGDQVQAYFAVLDLFKIARQKSKMHITGDSRHKEGISFEIPILPDVYGSTPLDICLQIDKQREEEKDIYIFKDRSVDKKLQNSVNQPMADVIFKYISEYGYMHSSQIIHKAIIEATKISLPSICDYLDSRMMRAVHCFESQTQYEIHKSKIQECPGMGEYGLLHTKVWAPEQEMKDQLFDFGTSSGPKILNFLDVPNLFKSTKVGRDFIIALGDSTDLNIFRIRSVQIMIDCHFRYWQRLNIWSIGMPLIIQLIFFLHLTQIALPHIDDTLCPAKNSFAKWATLDEFIINMISVYLIVVQSPNILRQTKKFFTTFEQQLGVINSILILYNTVNRDVKSTFFWTVQMWVGLTLWLRFALYLRSFEFFGYYIKMIQKTTLQMTGFLVIFFIGVLAFSDSFSSVNRVLELNEIRNPRVLSEDASTYEQYIQEYVLVVRESFMVALGDFGGIQISDYREVDFLVFFLCAIFNIILLFNLLIAIISEEHAIISENQAETLYQEKALNAEIMQNTFFGLRSDQPDHNERLFVAKEISTDQIRDEGSTDQIDDLREDILSAMSSHQQQTEDSIKKHVNERLDLLTDALSNTLQQQSSIQKSSLATNAVESEKRMLKQRQRELTQAIEENTEDLEIDIMAAFIAKNSSKKAPVFGAGKTKKMKL